MRTLLTALCVALLATACQKEEDTKPAPAPPPITYPMKVRVLSSDSLWVELAYRNEFPFFDRWVSGDTTIFFDGVQGKELFALGWVLQAEAGFRIYVNTQEVTACGAMPGGTLSCSYEIN
jgi:hypothetical protein